MLTIINILIVFFIILIIYQIFLAHFSNNVIEGLENYKEYDTNVKNDSNNVMILAQQNADNIEVFKKEFDNISGLKQQVQDISGNIDILTKQVEDLVKGQEEYLDEKLPEEPPEITGAGDEDEDEEKPEAP
jgi:predicted RND superfamily exporter protein